MASQEEVIVGRIVFDTGHAGGGTAPTRESKSQKDTAKSLLTLSKDFRKVISRGATGVLGGLGGVGGAATGIGAALTKGGPVGAAIGGLAVGAGAGFVYNKLDEAKKKNLEDIRAEEERIASITEQNASIVNGSILPAQKTTLELLKGFNIQDQVRLNNLMKEKSKVDSNISLVRIASHSSVILL